VFIISACVTLGIVALITLRDWIYFAHKSNKSIQKSLKRISQSISLKEWDLATKELSPLLTQKKGIKEAALFEIQILHGKGHFEEALTKIQNAQSKYPEEQLFRLEKGLILLQIGKPQEALEAFQSCSAILRGESDVLGIAEAYLRCGNPQKCLEVLNPQTEFSQNGQLFALVAEAWLELKNFQQAISFYNYAISLGSASHRIFNQLGHAHRRLGNLAEAENIFRNLLELDPSDIEAILGIGLCLQERGQNTKAFFIYQNGLSWSRDPRMLQKAAYTALRTKRYRQAESLFFELIQYHTLDPQTIAYYGLSLELQKKWPESEQNYLKLIELFPSSHLGYRALAWMFGVGLSQTISQEQGLNFAHWALKLQNDSISWEILSACTARAGAFDKAYQIQLTLAKQDDNPSNHNRRQQALRTLRKKMPLHDQHVARSLVA